MVSPLITPTQNPLVRTRNVYLMLICLIMLFGIVFGWLTYSKYRHITQAFGVSAVKAEEVTAEFKETESLLGGLSKLFEQDKVFIEEAVLKVLPPDEQFIELTKTLDNFFDEQYQSESEIIASNLRFGSPALVQGKFYSVLPLSLTITASREKFDKFLEFIENSGSLDALTRDAERIRLLDLQSIRMNFAKQEGKEQVSFTVELRAYFRNSEVSSYGRATGKIPTT